MSQLVEDCPRCNAKRIAFEVLAYTYVRQNYGWQNEYELFCVCGHCNLSTIFVIAMKEEATERALKNSGGLAGFQGGINKLVHSKGYISVKDRAAMPAPEHLPANILAAFNEGAKCMAIGCFNAAGTMFRLCVDMTTKDKLPEGEPAGLNHRTRRDLGLRLPWLIDNGYLPEDLRDLSHCIKEDGNDGAHQGTLSEADALDLLDFTEALLKRVYTEPERLRLAKERREQRRSA
ncbi:MAG: hypothetical protein JWQ01_1466 [Massilia sp.]|nr:hypothetical protein [Massilia sp.]